MARTNLSVRVKNLSLGALGVCILFMIAGSSSAGTIAWFYALDADKPAFEQCAGNPTRTVSVGSCAINEYKVGPHQVVAAKMGSGCVNTAATVATVMALYTVDRVVSTGPAGGLTSKAEPGTWLRVQQVLAWQSGRAGADGRIFPGEKALSKLNYIAEDWPGSNLHGAQPAKIVSGEAFIASSVMRSRLAAEYSASAVEMNAHGLLAGIDGRKVKLLVMRIVSDRADENASEDFALFLKNYNGSGGKIVAEIVQKLPIEPNQPAAYDSLRKLLK